jgi:polyisoprenoid-binding protein YceI
MIHRRLADQFVMRALLCAIVSVPSLSGAATALSAQSKPKTQELPAPGTYVIDPTHTFTYFRARHVVVGNVRGRFDKVSGTIKVSQNPTASSLDVEIDASSIDTQNTVRDENLRSADFFDVRKFPLLTYHGVGIHHESGNVWTMVGILTIRDTENVVPLRFTFNGTAATPPGKPARVAFHGIATTKRADFGLTNNLSEELGESPTASPDVEIEIDAEALEKPSKQ